MTGSVPVRGLYDLVIFDCDGVLIDSEVISTRSTVEALRGLGFEIDEADADRLFVGRSYATIRTMVERGWGGVLPADFEASLERRTLATMAHELEPVQGVADMLEGLEHPRCVASSSSVAWITSGLEKTGLLHHLEPHLFSASMVENGKPAPDIFLYAARKMGATPERALVVEDSLAGVQAGAAAGATVVGFTGGSHVTDPKAHGERLRAAGASLVIDDMAELPTMLAGRG